MIMILAIDIGATKTLLASFNSDGQALKKHKFATPRRQTDFYMGLLKQLREFDLTHLSAIGVAAPGAVDYRRKMIIRCGNLPWRNFQLASRLAEHFKVPVVIDNDCNLAALSEARWGAGKDYRAVLYTTISTGLGTGLAVDHQIPYPLSRMEAGRMYGQTRPQPKTWENLLSGPAIIRRFGKPAWEITSQNQWQQYARDLTPYLVSLVSAFGPDIVLLGGGVGRHFPKFHQPLKKYLNQYKKPLLLPLPPIRRAKHPETAVVYGCYLAGKTATIKPR